MRSRKDLQHLLELWLTAVAVSWEPWAKPHHITHARHVYVHLGSYPSNQSTPFLSAGRETQGQEGRTGCEDAGPLRAPREVSKASWSGFEVNQWAEWNRGGRKQTKSCRQKGKEEIKKVKIYSGETWRSEQWVLRRRLCNNKQVRHRCEEKRSWLSVHDENVMLINSVTSRLQATTVNNGRCYLLCDYLNLLNYYIAPISTSIHSIYYPACYIVFRWNNTSSCKSLPRLHFC